MTIRSLGTIEQETGVTTRKAIEELDRRIRASESAVSTVIENAAPSTSVSGTIGGSGTTLVDLLPLADGTALTSARLDHHHKLDQSIAPTWTGAHIFNNSAGRVEINSTGGAPLVVRSPTPNPLEDITGLEAWWKPETITGVGDGADVMSWPDSSSNGHHFTSEDPPGWDITPPLYRTDQVNGYGAVECIINSHWMVTDTFTLAANTGFAIFAVYGSSNAVGGPPYIIGDHIPGPPSSQNPRIHAPLCAGSPQTTEIRYNDGSGTTVGTTTLPDDDYATYHTFAILREDDGTTTNRVDSADITTGSPSNTTAFNVGRLASGAFSKAVRIVEILIYNRTLTSAERGEVERYLNAKYNLNDGGADVGADDLTRWKDPAGTVLSYVTSQGLVGIGLATPTVFDRTDNLPPQLHLSGASSGITTVSGSASQLVLERTPSAGMTMLSTWAGFINFGDSDGDGGDDRGRIVYQHGGAYEHFKIAVAATNVLEIRESSLDLVGALGVGIAADTLTSEPRLHVFEASSGASTVAAEANIAVFEGGAESGITILGGSGASGSSRILFGRSSNNSVGRIRYNYGNDYLVFAVGGNEVVQFNDPVIDLKGVGGTSGGPVLRFNSEASVAPTPVADDGHLYVKDVSSITELFYIGDGGSEVQLTKGGLVGGHDITWDSGAALTPAPIINFEHGLLATSDGSTIEVTLNKAQDPSGAVNLDQGAVYVFNQNPSIVGTDAASLSGNTQLMACRDVWQAPTYTAGTPKSIITTGSWKFTSYTAAGPGSAGGQTAFLIDIANTLNAGATPNYAFGVREINFNDFGMVMDTYGDLYLARSTTELDWSTGPYKVACSDYPELIPAGVVWTFTEQPIFINGADFADTPPADPKDAAVNFPAVVGAETAKFYYTDDEAGDASITPKFDMNYRLDVAGDIRSTGNIFGTNMRVFDGAVVETIDIDVSSNGTVITFNLDASPTGVMTFYFGGATYTLAADTTVALTAGTDAAPQINYVYVTESAGTLTLAKSTTGFPATSHAPIATVLCQSAASLQTDGAYKVHAWTDHINKSTENGHLSHINKKLRDIPAGWVSGCAGNDLISNEHLAIDTGVVFQLHDHTMPALTMVAAADPLYVYNDPDTAYNRVTTINSITKLSDGTAIGNNKYINLVLWGVVSEKDVDCQMYVNVPDGQYVLEADAQTDTNNTADYSIPADFKGTGFLIARYTLKLSGGTWTQSQKADLRGLVPTLSPSGGAITDHGQLAGLTDDDHPQYGQIADDVTASGLWTMPQVHHKPMTTGRYYDQSCTNLGYVGTFPNRTAAANNLIAVPFIVGRETAFDRICCRLRAGSNTGNLLRMGIYEMDTDGDPGALVVDAGEYTVLTDLDEDVEQTISETLAPGVYYLCMHLDTNTLVQGINSTYGVCFFGYDSLSDATNRQHFIQKADTYGALPDPFPAIVSANYINGTVHRIFLRVA